MLKLHSSQHFLQCSQQNILQLDCVAAVEIEKFKKRRITYDIKIVAQDRKNIGILMSGQLFFCSSFTNVPTNSFLSFFFPEKLPLK